ncbi:hypothetical protein QRO11_12005 [Paracidovorax citrulli]|uniref:Uncharacterized protein n=2 Tax=Paracidovorax citrulli TaxID=80869 RepID=A1TMN0_PARC0|nr:hypothetical protein [Paracidovorax citrulli]ABM32218.1 hypothetical protein Aave_1631 [Paracidovorax citrulli AAC00-1]ATG94765.1 hypothetical protein CQB05_12610 [Paracidovorax citrulli]MVT38509.1 hypothetical protein [Paracidovorax citrulli]PVY66412.1 hypothetical protein C8E08_3819 [Paracidovorax citrulli]REG69418.1 hypothetical protein C8E07_2568 [Paracidovorax citrulli]
MIDIEQLMFAGNAAPGQVEFLASATWIVPPGVESISMVCVETGGFGNATQVVVGGVIVCRALNFDRIGDGGGNGGAGGGWVDTGTPGADPLAGGGGGAGGYTGDGGPGASWPNSAGTGSGEGNSGGTTGYGGKGIGLKGVGSAPGSDSSGVFGGSYGGGNGGPTSTSNGSRGGALAWKNNVAVVPGQAVTITVFVPSGSVLRQGAGAVRIMWGGGRSYPNNAGDM